MKWLLLTGFFSLALVPVSASELYERVSQYEADKRALLQKYSLRSSGYFVRMNQFYSDWQQKLKTINFSGLSQEGKVDYILLKNLISRESYFHSIEEKEFGAIAFVLDEAGAVISFIEQRRRGYTPEAPALAGQFHSTLIALRAARQKLEPKPFGSWQQADRAAEYVGSLRDNLKEAYEFYTGYDPAFTWWVKAPYAQLYSFLTDYQKFLKQHFVNTSVKDDGTGIVGKPIGRAAIIESLRFEFIPLSPEELITLANKQFAWCEEEMRKASREMGYGEDWKKALEKVKTTYVPPGRQPALVDSLANEAIRFVEERDLITVPPLAKEMWRMTMMSPEAQRYNPFFLGGERIIIAYPTDSMEHDQKLMSLRGNNPHFSRATVQHELIPGHNLQYFMTQRYHPYREAFDTPFWTEGWALYWEFNLWDKGFPRTPEDRMGMLFWRMHRCARIIFSLNYHLGKMTPKQCIDFLVDRVGHEYANAEAEVRRSFTGRYGPLYQIAYMVGGLQFYALRKELADSGKMPEKELHDTIMKEGSMPVALIRALLTGQTLSEDFVSSWAFNN
jgi:uncharacterized protein (DUF885 family)